MDDFDKSMQPGPARRIHVDPDEYIALPKSHQANYSNPYEKPFESYQGGGNRGNRWSSRGGGRRPYRSRPYSLHHPPPNYFNDQTAPPHDRNAAYSGYVAYEGSYQQHYNQRGGNYRQNYSHQGGRGNGWSKRGRFQRGNDREMNPGGSDDIRDYFKLSMLDDPWKYLRQPDEISPLPDHDEKEWEGGEREGEKEGDEPLPDDEVPPDQEISLDDFEEEAEEADSKRQNWTAD